MDADSCDRRLIAVLRRLAVDVITAREQSLMAISDEGQLEHALELRRPIVTANYKDFVPMHTAWALAGREHPGIILWRKNRFTPEGLANVLAALCNDRSEEQFRNALIWIS